MSEVQLRQTYRDKIYNYKPAWILRWGVSFFFFFLLLIIVASGFIKYPDIVPAAVEITTVNPPAHLIARISGKIEDVCFQEGEPVRSGSIIVELESSGQWNDLKVLEQYAFLIDSMITDSFKTLVAPSFFKSNLELGEVQSNYAKLLINYNELFRFFKSGFFELEFKALKEQLYAQNNYLLQITEKKRLLNEQYMFALKKYKRDSLLFDKEVIPEEELELSYQNILQFRSSLSDIKINILTAKTNIESFRNDLRKAELSHEIEAQQLVANLKQNLGILESDIETWKQNYLIISPLHGNVSFTTFWSKNQNVKAGETVVSVVPRDSMHVRARLQFPVQNSGKVKTGQRVNIKLQNYPYQEFGMLVGHLSDVSKVPNELIYSADVLLDNGLVTSYGKKLTNGQQLNGEAEILTDDVTLLLRFFNPLRAIFNENIKR